MEDARPKSFGSEFSARLIWGSSTTQCHTLVALFHSIRQSISLAYHTTLPSCPSYWTFTLAHYIRRDAPPYFTMPAHPGFYLTSWDFTCAWARTYYYFLVPGDTRCFRKPAPLSSDSLGPQNRTSPCAIAQALSGKPADQLAHRPPR